MSHLVVFIVGMFVGGLIIGALGRLVVPGPNPMSLFRTACVGLLGSLVGGILGRTLLGMRYLYSGGLAIVIAVLCTAAIVYFLDRPRSLRR